MSSVLVDSSVWVAHFRAFNPQLQTLADLDLVVTHPMVIGEIACGTPPQRTKTLAHLRQLQSVLHATHDEVLDFIERGNLYGQGCGLVDLTLLTSAIVSNVQLWTLDRRLLVLAQRFKVAYQPLTLQPLTH